MMPTACVLQASAAYAVPVRAIEEVIADARGRGVGPMGIPAAWIPVLQRVGFAADQVRDDPCTNVAAGAWIMAYDALSSHGLKVPGAASTLSISNVRKKNGEMPWKSDVAAGCVADAARLYGLPLVLLKGVLATEAGRVGLIDWNTNGSYDMGPAQINSTWLPRLAALGISRAQVIDDGCLNVHIGAWILAQSMQGADPQQPAQFWQHVGAYNSRTPVFNNRYAAQVWSRVMEIANNH